MTAQQRDNVSDKIKIWAFPILLGLVTYFLAKMDSKIESVSKSLIEIQLNQLKSQIDNDYNRTDFVKLQKRVEDNEGQIRELTQKKSDN